MRCLTELLICAAITAVSDNTYFGNGYAKGNKQPNFFPTVDSSLPLGQIYVCIWVWVQLDVGCSIRKKEVTYYHRIMIKHLEKVNSLHVPASVSIGQGEGCYTSSGWQAKWFI
jgi:hypothetical protein